MRSKTKVPSPINSRTYTSQTSTNRFEEILFDNVYTCIRTYQKQFRAGSSWFAVDLSQYTRFRSKNRTQRRLSREFTIRRTQARVQQLVSSSRRASFAHNSRRNQPTTTGANDLHILRAVERRRRDQQVAIARPRHCGPKTALSNVRKNTKNTREPREEYTEFLTTGNRRNERSRF